jgi:CIC family chloride channel protein
MSVYYTRYFQRTEHYFAKLKLNPYKKSTSSLYSSCINFIFPTLFGEGYESKVLSEDNPGVMLENTLLAVLEPTVGYYWYS